ncbi:retinitis pigmentosa 1-like 1 protein [Ambystoma mexicanum]|uniref:retinitis pigmentosa 1-like 1 protein n=1 Tax=Ambystoma mexicanum TaxID=8296 RepID=UPI0037E80669
MASRTDNSPTESVHDTGSSDYEDGLLPNGLPYWWSMGLENTEAPPALDQQPVEDPIALESSDIDFDDEMLSIGLPYSRTEYFESEEVLEHGLQYLRMIQLFEEDVLQEEAENRANEEAVEEEERQEEEEAHQEQDIQIIDLEGEEEEQEEEEEQQEQEAEGEVEQGEAADGADLDENPYPYGEAYMEMPLTDDEKLAIKAGLEAVELPPNLPPGHICVDLSRGTGENYMEFCPFHTTVAGWDVVYNRGAAAPGQARYYGTGSNVGLLFQASCPCARRSNVEAFRFSTCTARFDRLIGISTVFSPSLRYVYSEDQIQEVFGLWIEKCSSQIHIEYTSDV